MTWILEAAAQLFHELGYLGTSTNKVAERAGVSVGSIYQYFPNKDALLAALADQELQWAGAASLKALDDAGDVPLPQLMSTLITGIAHHHTERPGLHSLLANRALVDPDLVARVSQTENEIADKLASKLRHRKAGGDDPQLSALLAVQGINAQIHHALVEPPTGKSAEEIIDRIVRMWTAALR